MNKTFLETCDVELNITKPQQQKKKERPTSNKTSKDFHKKTLTNSTYQGIELKSKRCSHNGNPSIINLTAGSNYSRNREANPNSNSNTNTNLKNIPFTFVKTVNYAQPNNSNNSRITPKREFRQKKNRLQEKSNFKDGKTQVNFF